MAKKVYKWFRLKVYGIITKHSRDYREIRRERMREEIILHNMKDEVRRYRWAATVARAARMEEERLAQIREEALQELLKNVFDNSSDMDKKNKK